MDTNTSPTDTSSQVTVRRLRHLASVSRFLSRLPNDSSEESEYFVAKQALNDFSTELLSLPLDPELKEDMRLFVEFLNTSLETKYQSHRR